MMTKKMFAALAVSVLLSGATLAHAADAPAPAEKPMPGEGKEMKFEDFKAKVVERMQKHLDCVKAAKDKEAFKECRPKHGRFGPHDGKFGKEGGDEGKMPE